MRSRSCNRRWSKRRSCWATFARLVLLPLCVVTGLPAAQLELILAHELAHIRRHDYLVNLLQTLVETLFFYHPAVWWLSRQIRNERENCCDDVAMAIAGSRADYGRALLAIEELRAASTALSLAASGGSLLARIRRIAGCEPVPRVVGGGSILGIVLVSLAIVGRRYRARPRQRKSRRRKFAAPRTTSASVGGGGTGILAKVYLHGDRERVECPTKIAIMDFREGKSMQIEPSRRRLQSATFRRIPRGDRLDTAN